MLNVKRNRWPWYGLAFGIILLVFGLGSAGAGHGTYLPLAIFAAPLSLVPLLGFFAAPMVWGLIGWLLADPRRWLATIITLSVHTAAVCLVLLTGNPQEPGSEQWQYFWQTERVLRWWLWTAIAVYVAGLITAWVFAIAPIRANRQLS